MKKLYVEVAENDITRSYGLMDRKTLASDHGMLFTFAYSNRLTFHMQNTYIPLDIAFIDTNGKILQISEMNPLSTRRTHSEHKCKYALEVNRGWFKDNDMKVGSYVAGEGFSHRRGKIVTAQGFWMNLWDKFTGGRGQEQQKEIDDNANGPMGQPEVPAGVPQGNGQAGEQLEFGEQWDENQDFSEVTPDRLYMEPAQDGEVDTHNLSIRDTIKDADENGLPLEVVYWTLGGYVLPPRRLMPLEGEGYPIKSGPNGEYMVGYDASPTINGAGWVLKGGQPKSFILQNIVSLQSVGQE